MAEMSCEVAVDLVLDNAGLRSHPFFTPTSEVQVFDVEAAWEVARAWRDITKAFMLTTVASLGVLAHDMVNESTPDIRYLITLQTGLRVIGDDLNNLDPVFAKFAPAGVAGIHYVWWEDTVLHPLTAALPDPDATATRTRPAGVQGLLDNMAELAGDPIGAAVQLRVVEDIALDIAIAFRRLFGEVGRVGGVGGVGDLAWIEAHIEAEVVHRAQVSDDETGMTAIAATPAEQQALLAATTEYATSWARALDDMAARAGAPAGRPT